MWNKIIDPQNGKRIDVSSRRGMMVLRNYIRAQTGGHNWPCAVKNSSGRCAKSKTSDGKCEVTPTGRCRKLVSPDKSHPTVEVEGPSLEKNEIGKVHKVSYLTHLLTEDYINDISQILYGRHFKVIDFIPFEEITKVIPNDMEVQYNDKTVGKKGNNTELMYNDSANWYNDHKNFNMNDVITDDSGGYSRSQFDAWLVVKQEGKLGLCMFPMSDGDWDNGFSDGDSINNRGEMIHPITRKLVKIGLF